MFQHWLVLFAQPRQSKVDIVQAVGRAFAQTSNDPKSVDMFWFQF